MIDEVVKMYTEERANALVAAAYADAARGFSEIAEMINKHTWKTPEGEPAKLFLDDGHHSGPAVDWIEKTLNLLKELNVQYGTEALARTPDDAKAALQKLLDAAYERGLKDGRDE